MASIRKHRGRFQVQIRRKGHAPITKSFRLLSDAKGWARHMERQADRGELGPDSKELERITLAELLRRYLDEVVPQKRHGETDTFSLHLVLRHSISKKRLSDLSLPRLQNATAKVAATAETMIIPLFIRAS